MPNLSWVTVSPSRYHGDLMLYKCQTCHGYPCTTVTLCYINYQNQLSESIIRINYQKIHQLPVSESIINQHQLSESITGIRINYQNQLSESIIRINYQNNLSELIMDYADKS